MQTSHITFYIEYFLGNALGELPMYSKGIVTAFFRELCSRSGPQITPDKNESTSSQSVIEWVPRERHDLI